jgi:long-chain acyl-CoA synthetase
LDGYYRDIPYPRGELLVKTKHMIRSYYNNTEETSAALDDGWFRTGDVVELIGPRQIKIVDRVKNFFKLSQVREKVLWRSQSITNSRPMQGEFVSPEPVENVYLQSPYIDQIVITHADLSKYQQTSVIAVVVPRLSMALEWWRAQASQSSTEEPSLAQLCQLEALKSFVCQELVKIGRKKGLRTFEIPYDIILDSISWTVENGLRTSSAKYVALR